jgi:hypothetical protein
MDLYIRFLYDFMSQFFGGLGKIVMGIFVGIREMFNFSGYYRTIRDYSAELSFGQWILVALAALTLIVLIGFIILLVLLLLKKYIRIRKTLVEQEALLDEVATLNRDVFKLTQEKERILAMKVSQLGLKPGEENVETEIDQESKTEKEETEDVSPTGKSRFYKLTQVDNAIENYVLPETNNNISLSEICDTFRNYAASKMGLYYEIKVIRLFLASFASNRLIVLQGISGTGKTSLPYAFGKFLSNDATIASVQPSWRDRTELFGYFNEFTRKFNETEVLRTMYEATYKDLIYVTILDEMNIARVEYYFAEMLSILEMPSKDEWIIDLVPNVWPNDPKKLNEGKLKLPDNMWYIGTINNDDSTFMVTDKVYDRAMPININDKGRKFEAPLTNGLNLSCKYVEGLYEVAKEKHACSDESLKKLEEMDNYVIEHFRLAFGNRIVKQLRDFVPAYVACGGTEIDAIDHVVANKILRKFEQLNLSFIRDEIDGFVKYLDKLFGEKNMTESKAYLLRLKKSI